MNSKLKKYNEKRNFEKTPEPHGNGKKDNGKMPRFVVQYHEARAKHYDFRLEWEGTLLSWAVPKGPSFNPQDKRLAVRVEDHPTGYIDFEGVIPKGEYGAGGVMVWDRGIYLPITDMREGLSKGDVKVALHGERLKGGWKLIRTKDENWFFMKGKDEYALSDEGVSQFQTSVKTQRTMAEITAVKNPFDNLEVQLAQLVSTVPDGNHWLYEIKYDGYRIVAVIESGSVRLMTRNHIDFTEKFFSVADALKKFFKNRAVILDGEMTVADERGKTDFQALQNAVKGKKSSSFQFVVFDIAALDGEDLRNMPLIKRKEKLSAVLKNAPENLILSNFVTGKGKECFEAARKAGLEGIVGKKADSVYGGGTRNGDWIKIKCYQKQEFVIGGFTVNEKNPSISALLLGYYDKGKFLYIGKTGTGFTEKSKKELKNEFLKIKAEKSAFFNAPENKSGETVYWLKPELVAEIQYAQITNDHLLRQASFQGLRADKDPKAVALEKAVNL